jgi:tRNA(Ile)-lysidine synthase
MHHPPAASFDHLGPWPQDGCVILACSGGADSTYLAVAWQDYAVKLADLAPQAQVWVVDHGHRPGSATDAAQARQLYQNLGFPVRVLRAESPPSAEDNSKHGAGQASGANENSLRRLRYGLLENEITALHQAGTGPPIFALLTAHHADDQAETVLLRIMRGTGLRGLAGIPARRRLYAEGSPAVEIRRPLLGVRAAEIREYLQEIGQTWIEDPTNGDPTAAARNRLRLDLMPMLAQIATGDPALALLRLSAEAAQWRAWVEQGLNPDGQNWAADWKSLPSVLRREAIAQELRRQGHTVSPTRLQNLETALLGRGSAAIDQWQRLSVAGGGLSCRPVKSESPPEGD